MLRCIPISLLNGAAFVSYALLMVHVSGIYISTVHEKFRVLFIVIYSCFSLASWGLALRRVCYDNYGSEETHTLVKVTCVPIYVTYLPTPPNFYNQTGGFFPHGSPEHRLGSYSTYAHQAYDMELKKAIENPRSRLSHYEVTAFSKDALDLEIKFKSQINYKDGDTVSLKLKRSPRSGEIIHRKL